jgi:tetratricopeptide (TPR) repeat protein
LRAAVEGSHSAEALRSLGIAHLALGDVPQAIAALEEAAAIAPTSVATRIDLSAAFLERWRSAQRSIDLVRVLEQTAAALSLDSDSPHALFNQALALEKLGLHNRADREWQTYLQLDSDSPWAAEARRHSDTLHARRVTSDVDVRGDSTAVYRYIENDALQRWTGAPSGASSSIDTAARLATELRRSAKDAYLADLLDRIRESGSWPASRRRALADGIGHSLRWRELIDSGEYQAAEPVAHTARETLIEAGVDPIEADFEIAYSDFSAGRATTALRRADTVIARANQLKYWRLAAKARRLKAVAAMLATRVSEAETEYATGLALAQQAGDSELAALFHVFLGEASSLQGEWDSAWMHLAQTLPLADTLQSMRQRFDVLNAAAMAARRAGLTHASMFFADELLRVTAGWSNPEGVISARLSRARALYDLGVGDRGVGDLNQAAELRVHD